MLLSKQRKSSKLKPNEKISRTRQHWLVNIRPDHSSWIGSLQSPSKDLMNSCSTYTLISPLVLLLAINQACLFQTIHATCVFLSKVKQGECLTVALPLALKSILRKRRTMETQTFHHAKI
jgi:hypothetical protein